MHEEIHYVIVLPYNGKHRCGIVSYTENLTQELSHIPNIKAFVLANNKNLNQKAFSRFAVNYITKHFKPHNTIIECPEVHGICRNIPPEYFLHVRLHCSSVITANLNGYPTNAEQHHKEVEIINRANVVSSPSKYLLTEMQNYFNISKSDLENILIYPNPLNLEIHSQKNLHHKTKKQLPIKYHKAQNLNKEVHFEKKYNLCFIANFSLAKGVENLNTVLENLPKNYTVCVAGNGAKNFKFSKNIQCTLVVFPHISKKEEVFEIIESSKAFLNLSKFESFGIGMFEAISLGTPIVGIPAPAVLEYISVDTFSQKVESIPQDIINSFQTKNTIYLNGIQEKFYDGITKLLQIRNNYDTLKLNISLRNTSTQSKAEPKKLFKLGYMQMRKMKKLFRDPALFFTDMYKNIKNGKPVRKVSIKPEHKPVPKNTENTTQIKLERKLEPREFAKIYYKNNVAYGDVPGRAINNERYSSVLFLEEDGKSLIHNRIVSTLLLHKEQMPLREKTLFFAKYAEELEHYNFFENYHNILDFRSQLLKSNFEHIKTFYFINPKFTIPFFFRSFFVNSRLVLFMNDEESLQYILQFKNQIDVLVVEKSLLTGVDISSIRRVITIEGNLTEQIATLIKKISIENARREMEIMLPVLGECGYTSKIQEYNKLLKDNLLDGVFIVNGINQEITKDHASKKKNKHKLHKMAEHVKVELKPVAMQTFAEVTHSISKNVIGVLLSENAMFRYRTLIAQGNVQALLRFALEDNLRIKIVNENEL